MLANQLLEKQSNKHAYYQSKLVSDLWKHEWRPVQFTLVVDIFQVKYAGEAHALHMKADLEEIYTITTKWEGRRYIGITLDWDYKQRQVHHSMPKCVTKALKQLKHKPKGRQHTPYPFAPIKYGVKIQYATQASTASLLDTQSKLFIQQVFFFLLVNCTLLCPVSVIASQYSAPTEDTMKQTLQFFNYTSTQEEAVLTYNASGTNLAAHGDASYLGEPKTQSRVGGHFLLSGGSSVSHNNGAVLNIAHIIKHVVSSATEA